MLIAQQQRAQLQQGQLLGEQGSGAGQSIDEHSSESTAGAHPDRRAVSRWDGGARGDCAGKLGGAVVLNRLLGGSARALLESPERLLGGSDDPHGTVLGAELDRALIQHQDVFPFRERGPNVHVPIVPSLGSPGWVFHSLGPG
ncbi:hypothetical protein GCM10009650_23070 [Nesterenkonia jeotgali]